MQYPLVSIIIPTYNRAELISETIDSIRSQVYENWECFVIDDGSTDNTPEILAAYCLKDKRIKYRQRPEYKLKGANSCRNFGFELCNGKYIKWFDSDDIMFPTFLEKQVVHLENNEIINCSISYGATFRNDINNYKVQIPKILDCTASSLNDFIFHQLHFSTPGPLWRREWLQNEPLFNESIMKLQDTEFHYQQLKRELKFEFLNEPLFLIRHSETNISSTTSIEHLNSISDYYVTILSDIYNDAINYDVNLRKYVINKNFNLVYRMLKEGNSFNERLRLYNFLKNKISIIINLSKLGPVTLIKIYLGLGLVLFFNRGLKFLKI